MHLCTLVFIYSYIAFYIHISLYHLRIPVMSSSIHILSIFLSCMLLLIHIFISYTLIFIYFSILLTLSCLYYAYHSCTYTLLCHVFTMPIIHVHILILMLCHLLLISIVLSIYAFLSCVPSMFHLIHFGITIIYSYHLLLYLYVPIICVL